MLISRSHANPVAVLPVKVAPGAAPLAGVLCLGDCGSEVPESIAHPQPISHAHGASLEETEPAPGAHVLMAGDRISEATDK